MRKMKVFVQSAFLLLLFVQPVLAQQELRPGNPIGGFTIKGGKNPGGQLLLADQVIKSIFSPLASPGFAYQGAEIVKYDAGTYLVTTFENRENKAIETIGVIMHPEGEFLLIKDDKPKKCNWNIYCKCELPICLGCQRSGGTYIEKCGFASITSAQFDSYNNSLARIAQPAMGPKKVKTPKAETMMKSN
jgi:hypothetical protein